MKRCSTALITRALAMKTSVRHPSYRSERPPSITSRRQCRRGCGEKGALVPCWWECIWPRHCGKQRGGAICYVIPLLGIYPKTTGTLIQTGTCTPTFIAASATAAKTGKRPRCPSTDEWIKRWYLGTLGYYTAIKKEGSLTLFNNTDGLRQMPHDFPYTLVESKKQKKTMMKQQNRNRLMDVETVAQGEGA